MITGSSTKSQPQVVKIDRALKLAEQWVNKMSASSADDWNESEFEGRPSRLGLGAKIRKQSEVATSSDPVERNLIKMLGVGKSKPNQKKYHSNPPKGDESSDEDEDELESRSNVFSKKSTT